MLNRTIIEISVSFLANLKWFHARINKFLNFNCILCIFTCESLANVEVYIKSIIIILFLIIYKSIVELKMN